MLPCDCDKTLLVAYIHVGHGTNLNLEGSKEKACGRKKRVNGSNKPWTPTLGSGSETSILMPAMAASTMPLHRWHEECWIPFPKRVDGLLQGAASPGPTLACEEALLYASGCPVAGHVQFT